MKPRRSAKVAIKHPATHSKSPHDDQLRELKRQARQLGRNGTRMAEAVAVNSRILGLDPEHLPALTRRGLSYLKLDDYPAAREDLSRALRLYPESTLVAEALRKIDRGWDAAPCST